MYYKLGQACVTNWGSFVYYELGQTLSQIGAAPLSKFRVRVVTDLDDYDKLGQQLLQNRVPITNLRKQST